MINVCALLIAFYALFDYSPKGICPMPGPTTPRSNLFDMKNQGTSDVPILPPQNPQQQPPVGGGGGQVQQSTPNPGDVDPNTGMRWSPGNGWLPPNFFSDLSGGGDQGGGGPLLPPAAGGLATQPGPGGGGIPGNIPIIPSGPSSGQFFEIPDQFQSYFPQDVLPFLGNYLRQLGYTGAGNIGQYGERTYANPGGNAPFNFSMDSLTQFVQDPRIRNYLAWFFGERGMPGFSRISYPGQTQ